MATPTAGKHGPGPAVATPPVSTPFSASNHHSHPAFSPHGPRSVVPSPQQLKKSPANSNAMYGYPGAGHQINSSFGVGYDSPSAAIALGVPGLELGLDGLVVPGGMGTPLGGVGVGSLGGVRGDEDERKRRLGQVVDILKVSKGRLSENGVERLAKRLGLDTFFDSETVTPRGLIIAGKAVAIDIAFDHDVVKNASLSFPDSPDIVSRHTSKAGEILLKDLQFQAHESPLTKKLDQFAANLEILAASDKLSVIPGLNCHEAIAGIYESIERLHIWEVERLKETHEMALKSDEDAVKAAMCTKSGKPVMHTRDRLGLSLEYWQEKRRLTSKKDGKLWSLLIDCAAPSPGLVYTPLRVSEHWISADVQKANATAEEILREPDNGPVLDWLEPESTLLPSTGPPKADAIDGVEEITGPKYPEVMFVAKFDPPLIVPLGLAQQIYNSTSSEIGYYGPHFDSLLFPPDSPQNVENNGSRYIKRHLTVHAFSEAGEKVPTQHIHELVIEKHDYGYTLTELPFSHPRQLVEMLPALRQYAFLSTVLTKSFGSDTKPPTESPREAVVSKRTELANFMSGATARLKTRKLDVVLVTQPALYLKLAFPRDGQKKGNETGYTTFQIGLNGAVEVVYENILSGDGNRNGLTPRDLGRMLEITEDLGVWLEFVKRRLGW
ncbi:hypothetical protein PZA11_004184 [Diplocarpon coronariae]|uniref:Mediator of RNA polymerase II transcription subunit 1 n=1 Tax=Diplocarpon coronariae TaxID=2795749 RepID=A0A218ZEH1_9HELO|nr:hypothetical protein JHW43_000942 [Diplocarpon mali]OWP06142.1 hypothetical protein B2J93_8525 [Marssonina coronariae]